MVLYQWFVEVSSSLEPWQSLAFISPHQIGPVAVKKRARNLLGNCASSLWQTSFHARRRNSWYYYKNRQTSRISLNFRLWEWQCRFTAKIQKATPLRASARADAGRAVREESVGAMISHTHATHAQIMQHCVLLCELCGDSQLMQGCWDIKTVYQGSARSRMGADGASGCHDFKKYSSVDPKQNVPT